MEIAAYLYFLLPTYSISCETVMDYLQTAKISRDFLKNINFQTFEVLTVKLDSFEKKIAFLFVIPTIQNLVKLS